MPDSPARSYDVFLSHDRRDAEAVLRIAERLHRAGVEPWLDRWCLTPGGDWQREMGEGLEASASCAVFVGGHDGGGAWKLKEAKFAIDRAAGDAGFRVFPVLLPGVEEPFEAHRLPHFLRASTWVDFRRGVDDGRALQDLIHATRGVPFGPDVPLEPRDDVCPYRGLEHFDAADAAWFFGRDRDVQRLLEKLKRDRLLAVLGPSGSGKSSLVRAGLVPALEAGAEWRTIVLRPGASPLTSLAAALAGVADGGAMQDTLDRLATDERTLDLAAALALRDADGSARLLCVVDQFEEVFTLCRDEAERRAFFANLLHAAAIPGGRTTVVITMRADFYARCAAYPGLAQALAAQQQLVGPMDADGLRQAIEEPARRAGLEFEAGLVDTILADAGSEAGALPLLEHALLELWRRRRGSTLTLEGYRDAGGVHGALAKRADEVFGELDAAEQQLARRTLLRLTQPGEGTEDTRRRAARDELGSSGDARFGEVLDRLVGARLLTAGSDPATHEEVVEVAHEALIRGWPRLRAWIDTDRAGLLVQRRLTDAAHEWERLGHDDSALYRGARLAEATEWAADHERDMTGPELAFLDASVALRDRERDQEEERRRRELADAQELAAARGQSARRLRVLSVVLLLGILAAGTAAGVALHLRGVADRERHVALSRQLAVDSTQQLAVDPELALRLALEAADEWHTAEAEASLRAALIAAPAASLHSKPSFYADFSADGRRVALTSVGDRKLRIWDAASRRVQEVGDGAGPVDFDDAGERVVTVGKQGVSVRDTRDGHELARWPGTYLGAEFVPPVAIAGRRADVLTWNEHGGAELRDSSTGTRAASVPGGTRPERLGFLADAAVDPAHRLLATSSPAAGLRVWRLGDRMKRVLSRRGVFDSVDFSASAHRLAAATELAVRVWDTRTWRLVGVKRSPVFVRDARLSEDGRLVLLRGTKATVWDLRTRATTPLRTARGPSRELPESMPARFSPDGRSVITASGSLVEVWDAGTGRRLTQLRTGVTPLRRVMLSADGDTAFTLDTAGVARTWSLGFARLQPAGAMLDAAAFDASGQRVAGVARDGTLRVWAVPDGRLLLRAGPRLAPDDPQGVTELRFTKGGEVVGRVEVVTPDGSIEGRFTSWPPSPSGTSRRFARGVFLGADGRPVLRLADDGDDLTALRAGRPPLRLGKELVMEEVIASADGRRVVAGDPYVLTVDAFDVPSGKRLASIDVSGGDDRLVLSPDGRELAVARDSGSITIWDLDRGRVRLRLNGHTSRPTSIRFDPGGLLASGASDDGTVRVWDLRTGRALETIDASGGADVSPDGRWVATIGGGAPPLLRPCRGCGSFEQLKERAAAFGPRTLTPGEQARYTGS